MFNSVAQGLRRLWFELLFPGLASLRRWLHSAGTELVCAALARSTISAQASMGGCGSDYRGARSGPSEWVSTGGRSLLQCARCSPHSS